MAVPLRKEATQVAFNAQTAWMLKFTLRELQDIFKSVERRTPGSPYALLSRPVTPSHQTAIEQYLAENEDWVIDTISLAAPTGAITQASKTINFDPGLISILDGQHRINAIINLLRRLEENAQSDRTNRSQNRLSSLLREEIPALLYEVATPVDQQRLYHLFSNRLPFNPHDVRSLYVSESPEETAIAEQQDHLDEATEPPHPDRPRVSLRGIRNLASTFTTGQRHSERAPDPFDTASHAAIASSHILTARMLPHHRGPDAQAPFLTEANIKDIATTIQLGIGRTASQEDRAASTQPDNQATLRKNIITFFDVFLPQCLPNYDILGTEQNFETRFITSKSNSYALDPPVIRLIANTWARWTIDYAHQPEPLAVHIGNLKMAKADPLNDIETSFSLVHGQRKRFQNPLHPAWEQATAKIIKDALS